MEKTVTLRFYDVDRTKSDKPAMADLLKRISKIAMDKRGRNVTGEGVFVRLENFQEDGDCIEGQFVRGQSGNRPGRMLSDGTEDLPFEDPIGHGIAFRYRTTDGLLAIEYNPLVLSPYRAMAYLYEIDPRAEFILEPRMREDAWEQFENRPLRKLTIGIAGHPDVTGGENASNATWANIGEMSSRYGAYSIKIEIGMGHRKGSLASTAKDFVRDAFRKHGGGDEDIRVLKGTVDTGDGMPNDEINLIGELLDVRVALNFPDNNWAKFYSLRRDLLRTKINLL